MDKTIIRITPDNTVTISRIEYNQLRAAKVQLDTILASKSSCGYYSNDVISAVQTLREKADVSDQPLGAIPVALTSAVANNRKLSDWMKDKTEDKPDA